MFMIEIIKYVKIEPQCVMGLIINVNHTGFVKFNPHVFI